MIDISKMNKAEVLAGLYNASHPQERGFLQTSSEDMTIEQAQSLFDEGYSPVKVRDYLHLGQKTITKLRTRIVLSAKTHVQMF